ncbi:hypothetical protein MNBD_GAMMA09-2557 [hydrothermal vent metagenome]|uniref:RND transporter n=1 Tax=hydrothermal vent metagenome TaxID=652676 RepID=A0A3B0YNV4_9ZZZZ
MIKIQALIQKIPLIPLAAITFFMAIAPVTSEPHLGQKLKMLLEGSLSKPIDIFDLFMHGTPMVLLIVKLIFIAADKARMNR